VLGFTRVHDLKYKTSKGSPGTALATCSRKHEFPGRYDLKLWMRDLKEGAAYLPK
jgi:hypothetical protein